MLKRIAPIENITNESAVGSGKVDHILFKLKAYRTFINDTNEELIDENSCRFGRWFNEHKAIIADDSKAVSSVNTHHKNVHQKAKEAVQVWKNSKFSEAIKIMKKHLTYTNNYVTIIYD